MAWTIKFQKKALKDLRKLDKSAQKRIVDFLEQRLANLENPRLLGSSLKGELSSLWRYRLGTYRILCEIDDGELMVLIVRVAHRKEVYH